MSGVSNTEPLRRLLREAAAAHEMSARGLEAAVAGKRAKTWLSDIQKAEHRSKLLTDDELDVLATAYKLPRRRIREADLEGHGLMERDGSPAVWLSQQEVQGLTDRQRRAVRAIVAAMLDGGPADVGAALGRSDEYDRAALPGTSVGRARREEMDRQAELINEAPVGEEPA